VQIEEVRAAAETSARVAREAEDLEQDRKIVLEQVAKDRPLDQIALAIERSISNHLPLSACSIQMELPDTQRISISPLVPERFAIILARIPVASIRATLSAAPIADLSGDPEWQRCVGDPGELPRRNYLAAPILENGLVAGMVVTLLPGEKLVTAADGELLESWAQVAGLAIERRGLYEQLSFRAKYDELTMLLNRASLYERMDAMTEGIHENCAMAVLYLDLDSFKEVNDQFGHAAGDVVLRSVSQRVLRSIRRTDVAARIGGDEFVVLLPGVSDRGEAVRVAELIGQALNQPIEYDGTELCVGSSVGIALYPYDARHTDALLKIADEEMCKAKLRDRTRPPGPINQGKRVLSMKRATADSAPLPDTELTGP
jgi:diguanylate cyclase (GGDEF)-like protein